jgi:hypothetical protein
MCSRLRTYAIKKFNLIDIELSYESGCDIYKMINWLKTSQGARTVRNKDYLIFSLGTNDVGRYGVDVSLERCSEIIAFIRWSFPGIRAIGWLALSPRWKPMRFVSAVDIGDLHRQFNERLQVLSKQLDFDVVDARLGPLDMRVEDGLHPSTTTGRWKYEEALRAWFSSRAVTYSSSSNNINHNRNRNRNSNSNSNSNNNNNSNINNKNINNNINDKYRENSSMIDRDEIPVARPFREKYSDILNSTLHESDNDSDSDTSEISIHSDIMDGLIILDDEISDPKEQTETKGNNKRSKRQDTSRSARAKRPRLQPPIIFEKVF